MIPIVINNRNRMTSLKKLIDWLLKTKNKEIYVLDNDSTYEPLIEYYKTIEKEISIVKLNKNLGHKAIYDCGFHSKFKKYFIYTDSDIVPSQECPENLIEYLIEKKIKHKNFEKIGLALNINDIPENYFFKKDVIEWEKKYWLHKIKNDDLYIANVDTTFAIYDNQSYAGKNHCISPCLRTNFPYTGHHLPWYVDSANIDDEEKFYIKNANAKFIGLDNKEKFVSTWCKKIRKIF